MNNTIEIFGKEIQLKTHHCALFGNQGQEIEDPYVNLYLRTKNCNSRCAFCTYHSDASVWDEKRYIEVLTEITKNIRIRKVAVSGGEPTLYWDNFKAMTQIAKEFAPFAEMSMNTDGLRWERLFSDPVYKDYDYIQLSRHHYNDVKNDEIFKSKTPSSEMIKSVTGIQLHPHQIQFRCNLMKDYIDNKEEVFKYLDWSNSLGINDIGLVSLMPINEFSKENYIYFHIKELIGDNFLLTKKWERHGGGCECFNYVYMPPEDEFRNPIRVYHKNTYAPNDIKETLVFDGKNLRIGFEGEVIF